MTQPTVEPLRNPGDLTKAVSQVILQNRSLGYVPTRFMTKTGNGYLPNSQLLSACVDLLTSPTALDSILDALQKYPTLLTLEDFVKAWGDNWGFSQQVVDLARARVETFDKFRVMKD